MPLPINQIINGDCIKGMADLKAESVDLAFADPPFNIGYDYDVYDDRKAADEYVEWSRRWISGVIRVLKPDGTFWLAIGDEYAAELKVLCTDKLGLHCRSWVIWFYTFGVHCKKKFTRSHAHLFHFVKNPTKFTFNMKDIRVPSARQLVYGDKRAEPGGRMPDDTWIAPAQLASDTPMYEGFVLRPQDIPDRFPAHSDMWYFSRVAGTFGERRGWHGCQMPEQLLGRIIRACSDEREVVLDPFAGSGTTLAVAKKLNRHFVGFELSKSYVQKVNERIKDAKPGSILVGPENPERSAPSTNAGRRLDRTRPSTRRLPVRDPAQAVSASPVVARVNATLGQVAVANREFNTAIAEAFIASHQGYSADRVVADPALNEQFLSDCGRLTIPGGPVDWNRMLLNLRKQGGLAAIDTSRRTLIRSKEMEPYAFASEIAWKITRSDQDLSLDEILVDPVTARIFDRIAERIAPGFSPFEYRWAALAVRKMVAKGNGILDRVRHRLGEGLRLTDRNRLPDRPAHYVITLGETCLFVGFTESLQRCFFLESSRIKSAAEAVEIPEPTVNRARISFQLFDPGDRHRLELSSARRSRLVSALHPVGNIPVGRVA